MKNFASLFSCAGCVDQLPRSNGFSIVYANEKDPEMADLYKLNFGNHVEICDILEATPPDTNLDWLHASPPCTLDSPQRSKQVTAIERENQAKVVASVHKFANNCDAKFVSIENVAQFYTTEAFTYLKQQMHKSGYQLKHHRSTVLGIGQKRRRAFAFFYKDLADVPKLKPTSRASSGWGDLINVGSLEQIGYKHLKKQPALIEKLLKSATMPFIIERGRMHGVPKYRFANEPLWTIVAALADDYKQGSGRKNYLLVVTPDGTGYNMNHDQLKLLQGFAPDFRLGVNTRIAVRAIGNACSPNHLEQAIGDVF